MKKQDKNSQRKTSKNTIKYPEEFTFNVDDDSLDNFEFSINLDDTYDNDEIPDYSDNHERQSPSRRAAPRQEHVTPHPRTVTPRQASDENEEKKPHKKKKGSKKPRNIDAKKKQIVVVMYSFLALFLVMIGYFIYFNAFKGQSIANNPNNVRTASLQKNIVRGKILSSDGTVLADSQIDDEGNVTRHYPFNNVFAHVIGTSTVNKSGLEASAESLLLTSNANPLERAINEIRGDKNIGDSIITTLNINLQKAAYEALGDNQGVVVAIEPSTGKILAAVSKPDYDPNTLAESYQEIIADENSKVLLNQVTQGTFVPGSIFKIVTALAYMRSNDDYQSYSYNCPGNISLDTGSGSTTLTCFNSSVHGNVNFESSFIHSCNASFANIGLNLDANAFTEVSNSLLFNTSLPTSIAHTKSSFSLSNTDTNWLKGATAIGQGNTTITPLHAAMIVSSIANGGVLMEPYMIDSVKSYNGGNVEKFMPVNYGSLMSTSDASTLTEMMRGVVTSGTATSLSNLGFSVAGKTGTAEVDNSGNNTWFVGFAPVDNPKIAICVLVENSESSSSKTAVPIAGQVLSAYFK